MPNNNKKEIFLKPGEFFVGTENCRVSTLLGSCVSITIWHRRLKIGAMSHFLLPTRKCALLLPDARYADEALWLMLRGLALRDVRLTQCEAKIFGGGNMFPLHDRKGRAKVGESNGHAARGLLTACGIPIVSESLFGNVHRRIVFDIETGNVWSRQTNINTTSHSTPTGAQHHVSGKAKGYA